MMQTTTAPPTAELRRASIAREKAIRSLAEFTRQAWPIIEPGVPLVDNWTIDVIAEHLEAVARGQLRRLVIAIPPGFMKSTLMSVMFPAWIWTWRPTYRSIFASYDKALGVRDSLKARAVVRSDWYRENFARGAARPWRISPDQDMKTLWQNSRGGFRQSVVVLKGGTGHRADGIFVDDAMSVEQSYSRPHREAVIRWFDKTMSSRLTDLASGVFVVTGQRLHRLDLSGHCIRSGYAYLAIPQEYDPRRSSSVVGRGDPRKEQGALAFPAKFPAAELEEQYRKLGSAGKAAQHQQDPVAEGGNLFQRGWWRFWRHDGAPPMDPATRPEGCSREPAVILPARFEMEGLSLDCTFRKTDDGSGVALQVWAAVGADRFLLYRSWARRSFTETVEELRAIAARFPGATWKWVEAKANGDAVMSLLEHEIAGLIPVEPEGGKEARAHACTAEVQSGNCYLPEHEPWIGEYVDAMGDFPKGEQDDDVDATTQALTQMRGGFELLFKAMTGNP